jgi:hypothetical protein
MIGGGDTIMKYVVILSVVAALAVGCGKNDESVGKKAGKKLGQQLTDFTKGIGEGVDQKMMVQVSLSPEVRELGLTNTVAKSRGLGSLTNGFSVYFIASRSVSNTLIARALNSDGVEMGRAKKLVVLQEKDAGYVTFDFEEQMDTQVVKRYTIGL